MSLSNEQSVAEFYTALAAGDGERLLAIQSDDIVYNIDTALANEVLFPDPEQNARCERLAPFDFS